MSTGFPAYGTRMIRCSNKSCRFTGFETDLVQIVRPITADNLQKSLIHDLPWATNCCPLCKAESYYYMTEKEIAANAEPQRCKAAANVNSPASYTQSEAPIVSEGRQARADGQPVTANPYPQVCQTSIRDHWLWNYGWQRGSVS